MNREIKTPRSKDSLQLYAPFMEDWVYCFAHASRYVGQYLVSHNLYNNNWRMLNPMDLKLGTVIHISV